MALLNFEDEITVEGRYSYISKVLDFGVDAGQDNWAEFQKYITTKNDNLESITKVTITDGKQKKVIGGDGEITHYEVRSSGGKTEFIGQIIF